MREQLMEHIIFRQTSSGAVSSLVPELLEDNVYKYLLYNGEGPQDNQKIELYYIKDENKNILYFEVLNRIGYSGEFYQLLLDEKNSTHLSNSISDEILIDLVDTSRCIEVLIDYLNNKNIAYKKMFKF